MDIPPALMNTSFHLRDGELWVESLPVVDLAARYGTPLYVYSRATFQQNWLAFDQALSGHPHQICYAVKANSNISLLSILAQAGSGFDIVSQGELKRVLQAGGDPKKVVFSGVGKLAIEIAYALEVGVGCFNVESPEELHRIHEIAIKLGKIAPIAIRVNPDVDAGTHPYISTGLKENKFGVDLDEVMPLYQQANQLPGIKIVGIACHIGSQLMDLEPFLAAFDCIQRIHQDLKKQGIEISQLDLGGGLGVTYRHEKSIGFQEYGASLLKRLQNEKKLKLILEPGRAIVANAGILVTRVEYSKHTQHKNFVIVDAGMNDLLRPALYQAEQEIIPVKMPQSDVLTRRYDVVGPVCETSDFLGKDRKLAVKSGDYLAVLTAGAYGFSMSSNYNTRPRAAEILVEGNTVQMIRERETFEQLLENEILSMNMASSRNRNG